MFASCWLETPTSFCTVDLTTEKGFRAQYIDTYARYVASTTAQPAREMEPAEAGDAPPPIAGFVASARHLLLYVVLAVTRGFSLELIAP
eukprot:scaffold309912_cov31-Tisochrysis_lutea.AAC.1